MGIKTQERNVYNRHGNLILSKPRGMYADYPVPQFSIHRGDFQMLLLSAVKERLGEPTIHLNHTLTSFDQNDGSITARFSQRTDGAPAELSSVTGDILIAADGINSTAHALLYPNEGPPRYSGKMLWRSCTKGDTFLTGASMLWAGHADQKFIAYPISQRSAAQGKSLVNWIAELRIWDQSDEDLIPPKNDWTKAAKKEDFAELFATWRCGGLEVADLINNTETVYEFPVSDRGPAEWWSFGRLTLLGDAAHATYPTGSNGASHAIIDADTLAGCLTCSLFSIQHILKTWEAERRTDKAKMVRANQAHGPDYVLQRAEERAPDGFENVHDVIPREELDKIAVIYESIARHDLEGVNWKVSVTAGKVWELDLKSPADWV
jgi:2-polyprenyl-6-methoxyphenol hydroxylase-like FAD-dependent oxidoreductase